MSEQMTQDWPPVAKTSRVAIASMILGVAGFLTCGVSAIVGLALGVIALVRISKSRGQLGGQGFAIAGVAVSVASLLFAGILLYGLARLRESTFRSKCMCNVGVIAMEANQWLSKCGNGKYLPPSQEALVDKEMLDPMVYICRSTGTKLEPGKFVTDYESILDMASAVARPEAAGHPEMGCGLTAEMLAGAPIVWDKKGNHADGRNVAYLDQAVEFVPEEQFEAKVMKRVREALEKLKAEKPVLQLQRVDPK